MRFDAKVQGSQIPFAGSAAPNTAIAKRNIATPRPHTPFRDSAPTSPAAAIYALSGELSPEQVKLVESNVRLLSDRQISYLAEKTDISQKSVAFRRTANAGAQVNDLTEKYWHPRTDDKIRLAIPGLTKNPALTPSMVAQLQTVLLVGPVTKDFALTVDWSKPFDLGAVFNPDSSLYTTDLDALKTLQASIMKVPAGERDQFMRATAYELAKVDPEMVNRLVDQLGVDTIKKAAPSIEANDVAGVACELASASGVQGYLRTQRVPARIKAYAPTSATLTRISRASEALTAADDFARSKDVTVASKPETLEKARNLYAKAASGFKNVLAHDSMAMQDPAVKEWMGRRAKALFVQTAVRETESGTSSNKFVGFLRRMVRKIPGVDRVVNAPGLAEKKLLDRLSETLGFNPAGKNVTPEQRADLFAKLEGQLLIDQKPDPLTAVDLPPQTNGKRYDNVHILFAPGVVPIDGVLDDTFRTLQERMGIQTEIAKTGFFHSEAENAQDMSAAADRILAKDPNAKMVMYGYSQGAANGLYYLDQLRSGSSEDRALADRFKGVVSLYGAHNGSTSAEDGYNMVKNALGGMPWGKQTSYLLSGVRGLGKWLGGGVDSLKRSTRRKFWQMANIPSDIPYLSITAATKPDEVPAVLKKGYSDMKKAAVKLGLAGDNDTQVLRCDGPMGNTDTLMGRAVRRNTVNLEVAGHHWNPLRGKHMPWDDAGKYAFPKTPQIESQLALFAELGLLDK